MSRELIKQLKTLKNGEVNPRAEWLTSNREILLSQIKNTISPKVNLRQDRANRNNFWSTMSIFMPKQFVFNVLRPAMVLVIILSVVTSGWINTVDAAYEALPGDWLYPAKRASEKTRMTVASVMKDKKEETKLHVEFAKRRAQETKKIISDPDKKEKVAQVVADLKSEMKQADAKLEEIKNDGNEQMSASMAKEVNKNTEQIKTALQDIKNGLLESTTTADVALTKELSEAKDMAKDTAVKTVEVIISKHLEGDNTFSKEEITEVIDKTLQTAVNDIKESRQDTEGVNRVVAAVKTEMKDLAKDSSGFKQSAETVSSTKNLNEKITAMATEVKDAAVRTEAVNVETDKKITEARDLLTAGDLAKVIDKVKEVTEASKEVEKITDQTLKNVQTVLPIVSVVKDGTATSVSSTLMIIVTSTPGTPTIPSASTTASGTKAVVVPVIVPLPTVIPSTTKTIIQTLPAIQPTPTVIKN